MDNNSLELSPFLLDFFGLELLPLLLLFLSSEELLLKESSFFLESKEFELLKFILPLLYLPELFALFGISFFDFFE